MRSKRAFTLIELLVVIAIIAILAAILFPVFAKAKESANQASGITHAKQLGTALELYLNDHDDRFPLAYSLNQSTQVWRIGTLISTPAGWRGGSFGGQREREDSEMWANSIQPYVKNWGVYSGPGIPVREISGVSYTNPAKPIQDTTFMMNGLLHRWSQGQVSRPSQLPLMWAGFGKVSMRGFAFSNPTLNCPQAETTKPCVFRGDTIRGLMYILDRNTSHFLYNQGTIVVFADTSAKWRRIGAQLAPRPTDYRVDPFTNYNARGIATHYWAEGGSLYGWLFRPDYDFNQ